MKQKPDETSIETLLKGQVDQPSARFEQALGQIPSREQRRSGLQKLAFLVTVSAAALLVLSTIFLLKPAQSSAPPEQFAERPLEALDPQWLELFTLADAVAGIDSLTNEETRLAVEFYAFNQ